MKTNNQNPAQYEWGPFPFENGEIYSKNFTQRTQRKRRTQRKEGRKDE